MRMRGVALAAALIAASPAQALDRLDIAVAGGSEDLAAAVQEASQVRLCTNRARPIRRTCWLRRDPITPASWQRCMPRGTTRS
jgi:hypothetical protein